MHNISQIKEAVLGVLNHYNPKKVGLFGSYSRNEQNENSDIDILVDFNSNYNLLDLIGMEQELSEVLGRKVDLITEKSLHNSIKKNVEKDILYFLND